MVFVLILKLGNTTEQQHCGSSIIPLTSPLSWEASGAGMEHAAPILCCSRILSGWIKPSLGLFALLGLEKGNGNRQELVPAWKLPSLSPKTGAIISCVTYILVYPCLFRVSWGTPCSLSCHIFLLVQIMVLERFLEMILKRHP